MLKKHSLFTFIVALSGSIILATSVSAEENIGNTQHILQAVSDDVELDTMNEQPTLVEKTKLININTASEKELTTLAGIGKYKAAKILQWRKQYGDFKSTSELVKVSGIGKSTIKKIEAYITVL